MGRTVAEEDMTGEKNQTIFEKIWITFKYFYS